MGPLTPAQDARWMGAALAYGERGRGLTVPNPSVGCVIVRDSIVVGRGWTQPGGRPHAEAMAVAQAGDAARGATAYVTLEPCSVRNGRGPACADVLVAAGIARVVVAIQDPNPRIDGQGFAILADAGIAWSVGVRAADAERAMAGFLMRQRAGRPHVTLKLATSIDGCIAKADGASRWITGPEARAHGHMERAKADAILVGRGTLEADDPRLDVRLAGLEARSPRRLILSRRPGPKEWETMGSPADIATLANVNDLLVEGGAQTAAAFLRADLVDRLLLYRAPILIGGGRAALGDIGLERLDGAHGRWVPVDRRRLGSDTLDVYERARCSPES